MAIDTYQGNHQWFYQGGQFIEQHVVLLRGLRVLRD
jgi:hypothetical protein